MKLQFIYTLLVLTLLLTLQSVSGGRAAVGGQDRTGAPGSLGTCAACHSNPGSFSNPTITIDVKDASMNSVTSYTPGETYTLEFRVTSGGTPAGYGMQAVVLDVSNNNIGDMLSTSTSNTQLSTISNGREFIEHLGTSPSGVFATTWTAPLAGTGNITIYGIGIAVNGTATNNDNVSPSTSMTLTEAVPSSSLLIDESSLTYKIFPNPNQGAFNILNERFSGLSSIRIFDIFGKTIYTQQHFLDKNTPLPLSLENISSGVYWVEINSQNHSEVLKIILE